MSSYNRNAFTYATIVAMGGLIFGLDAALISGTVSFISQEFSLSDLQLGTVVSAPGLGVLFALPFVGYFSDLLGRKKCLQYIAAFYVISAVASTFSPNYWSLVIARFIGGTAWGSITLASMYIGEISPSEKRGKLVSMTQINIVIGLSIAYFINYLILNISKSDMPIAESLGIAKYTWRWMLGTEILPTILWFILLLTIPKSPYWLTLKGKTEEAKNTLRKLIPENQIISQIEEMKSSMTESNVGASIMSQLKEIFSKRFRTIFIIAATIAIAQQTTGINAIMFYATTVVEQLGFGTDAAFQQAIWFGLVSLFFTILSLMLVDKVGRRPMILWGMVWIIASLGVCSWGFKNARYNLPETAISEITEISNPERLNSIVGIEYDSDIKFKEAVKAAVGEDDARDFSSVLLQKSANMNGLLILLGILSFIAAFHFSVGPIMWVLFSELFPISIRGVAIPFFALVTSVTSYLIQKFFPWQLSNMGGSAIFLFYAVTVAIGLVILYFYLPETKNMSIEKIQKNINT